MTLRERLLLVLIAVTAIAVMALLPAHPKSREALARPSPVNWIGVNDDRSQVLSLTWQGIIGNATAQPGSWIQRNLEKRFNISLTPIFMDVNAYGQRRPLMLCGGDIPDVMWSGDPLQVRANVRNGFVMELPHEVILRHCPTYAGMVNRYGKEAWLYSCYKGKNYGLPTIMADAGRPRIGAWRMDWLRKVGIAKVPESVGEMHEALYRFRHNDPDGNGVQDTYGWSPPIFHWSVAFADVFAAYGVLPFDLMERDGKVVWGGLLPETREALQELRRWHDEDLFDPDFLLHSQGGSQESMPFVNGMVGYLYPLDQPGDYAPDEEGSTYSKTKSFSASAEVVPAPPLKGRDGRRRGRAWGGAAHSIQFGKPLENQPEKVIRVLEMMEAIAKDETLYMQAHYGERGVHWDSDPRKGIVSLPPFKGDTRRSAAELLGGTFFFFPSSLDPMYDDKYAASFHAVWYRENRQPEWAMVNVFGKTDILPSSGRYVGDLMNFQFTAFMEMITGKRDIATFDAFTAEWLRRGGDQLLREANAMSRDVHALYEKVGAAGGAP